MDSFINGFSDNQKYFFSYLSAKFPLNSQKLFYALGQEYLKGVLPFYRPCVKSCPENHKGSYRHISPWGSVKLSQAHTAQPLSFLGTKLIEPMQQLLGRKHSVVTAATSVLLSLEQRSLHENLIETFRDLKGEARDGLFNNRCSDRARSNGFREEKFSLDNRRNSLL